jgi:chaperonin GroEL
MGAFLTKEAMAKTTKTSGDGTTATCVLLYAIFKEALKYYAAGVNPVLIKKGIEKAVKIVIEYIKTNSKPATAIQDIEDVANIALNGDKHIAGMIANAMRQAGKDGLVVARESNGPETYLEMVEGMQFEQGAIFGGFLNPSTQELILDNPAILCFDGMIRTIPQIQPIAQILGKEGRSFLILCDNMNQDVAEMLIHNHLKNVITCCVVRTPGTGRLNEENLKDLAVYTGAKLFSETGGGADLSGATFADFGSAERVKIKLNETMIFNGGGKKADIAERVQIIRKQIEDIDDNDPQKELYLRRIARLTSSIGIINVGGQTIIEMQELKDRVDDAIQAVKAAKSDGIVSGGGNTYLFARKALRGLKSHAQDELYGVKIVEKALEYPIRTIINNAGLNADVIINKIEEQDNLEMGYDVANEIICNIRHQGIIDPSLVLITAIKNAASIAIQMLMTRAGIVEKGEEKSNGKV